MKKSIIITVIVLIIIILSGVGIGVSYFSFKDKATFKQPYVFVTLENNKEVVKYVDKEKNIKEISKLKKGIVYTVYDRKNDANIVYSTGDKKIIKINKSGKSKIINLCKKYPTIKKCKKNSMVNLKIDKKGNIIMLLTYLDSGYGYASLVVVNKDLKLIYNKAIDGPVTNMTLIKEKLYLLQWYSYNDKEQSYSKVIRVDYKKDTIKEITKERKEAKDDNYIGILNNSGKYNILYLDKKYNYNLKDSANNKIIKSEKRYTQDINDVDGLYIIFDSDEMSLEKIVGKKRKVYDLIDYESYLGGSAFVKDNIYIFADDTLFVYDKNELDNEPKEYYYGLDELINNENIQSFSFFTGE